MLTGLAILKPISNSLLAYQFPRIFLPTKFFSVWEPLPRVGGMGDFDRFSSLAPAPVRI